MAGHSKFKNIMHRKGAQDKKRAKLFSRLIREVTVAAQGGMSDQEKNPRLRSAVAAAQAANMPKDTIERAIRRGSGAEEGESYTEIRYEGYGPGGVAVIVETLTDNRNRTAAEIRAAFSKNGGNLGETGSVAHVFERVGAMVFARDVVDADTIFEAAVQAGAEDIESSDLGHEIFCDIESFHEIRDALARRFGVPESAGLIWKPRSLIEVDAEKAAGLLQLIDVLDNSDDVQSVAANYDISDVVLDSLTQ